MYLVICISFLAVLLTWLDGKGLAKNGMAYGFVLVAILGCIHYNYGNDYAAYLRTYERVTTLNDSIFAAFRNRRMIYGESGWLVLNYIFKYLGGFYTLVAILNVVINLIYYKFIKNNVDRNWWAVAVATYLFSTNYYVLGFSMMRQSLVIAVFIGMWPWIRDKKWFLALPVLVACTFIHKSANFLLPFAFFGFLPLKHSKLLVFLLAGLFVVLLKKGELINSTLSFLMEVGDFERYDNYLKESDDKKAKLGIGFFVNCIPMILSFWYLLKNNEDKNKKQIVTLSIISSIIIPFSRVVQLIGRIGIYFGAFSIIAVPIIYSSIKDKYLRNALLFIYIFMLLYDYLNFFESPVFKDHYQTFHTIFEAL